jgi:predicted ester cyclase
VTLVESGRAAMEGYLEALQARGAFADYFTDDVTIDIVGSGQTAVGRAAVEAMIRYVHEQAFDARAELKSLVVEGNSAAIEADFVGRQVGDFAGVAPTGREIRAPYSVHYDLASGRIKALRIYGLAADLIRELSA